MIEYGYDYICRYTTIFNHLEYLSDAKNISSINMEQTKKNNNKNTEIVS